MPQLVQGYPKLSTLKALRLFRPQHAPSGPCSAYSSHCFQQKMACAACSCELVVTGIGPVFALRDLSVKCDVHGGVSVVRCVVSRSDIIDTQHKHNNLWCGRMTHPEQIGEVSRRGGWLGSPNSIAALMRCQVPHALQRKCRRCGGLAVRGEVHCTRHLGRWSPLSAAAGRAESRMLGKLERAGLLPLELLALPVWRNLAGIATSQRAPMRLALVQAWDKRYRFPVRWASVQRQALELGSRPGKRQNTAPWYENI